MTIVLPKYEMIEFSWEKECGARVVTAPKVYTANQLMVLFTMSSISIIAVLVFIYLRFKKRRSERERGKDVFLLLLWFCLFIIKQLNINV